MAAGSTYSPIATTTLGSAAASYTFSSISGSYTDLILVMNLKGTVAPNYPIVEFNGDTGSNYSNTWLSGNGSSAVSARYSNGPGYLIYDNKTSISEFNWNGIFQIQNYSNTTTYKTGLMRNNNGSDKVEAGVLLWRNTAAINQVVIRTNGNNWASGSTFTLYGIASA